MQNIARAAILGCPLPGGAIEGESIAAPQNWAASDAVDVITVQTNPGQPYSVNIWGVSVDEFLYVGASDPESPWSKNIQQDERVRVRIGEAVHDLKASLVDDPTTEETVRQAFIRKYKMDPEDGAFEEAAFFRLEPR